jgi:hypothetical protein
MDCYSTEIGYLCNVEITVSLSFKMLLMHHNNIRIRGYTSNQQFIKKIDSIIFHLIECNHCDFNKENIPICELQELEKDCRKAISVMDNEDIIHQCNFTKHEPTLAVRTFAGGLLAHSNITATRPLEKLRKKWVNFILRTLC